MFCARKGYRKGVSVIPQFGVDPASFQIPSQRDANIFRIGYAGRLVSEKGIDILLRAVATLSGNWELRIVGSGPDLARLQSLARELQIDRARILNHRFRRLKCRRGKRKWMWSFSPRSRDRTGKSNSIAC